MKKKILISIFASFLFAVGILFNSSNKNESLEFKNAEALAQTVGVGTPCMHIDGYQCYTKCPECGDGILIIQHPK